ncbi:MAG: fibronectin type III domain-containing protein [Thermoguttaceae bacterium]|nr:fibronectin type III domain-containing protein [Thermoguttaceae bacterium]
MQKSFEHFMSLLNHNNRSQSPKHHRCQLESLEERALLSAVPLAADEYTDLQAQYADFNCTDNSADLLSEPAAAPAEITASPSPNQDVYNTNQTAQIKSFLEQTDAQGVKNGLKINAAYNANDPSTWTGVTWTDINGQKQATAIDWTGKCLVGSANFSQLTSLTSLSITGANSENYGGLTSLNISGCTKLISLNLYYNQLTSLNLANNKQLNDLDCTGNQIASLDLTNNTALTYLRVYENSLKTLDVSHNTNLVYLITCYNQLTTLDVSHNTKLEWLQCYDNQIVTLDLTNNPKLETLICWNPTLQSVLMNPAAVGKVTVQLCVWDNTPWTFKDGTGKVLKTTNSSSPTFLFSELPVYSTNQAGTQTIAFELVDNSVYDETECAKIKAFLNQNGNGTKVNPAYSADHPSTWSNIEWVEVNGVNHVSKIDWTGKNLAGSADFSNFKYLKILAITGASQENPGNLTSLNISGCTALEGCDCYYNKLTTLNLTTNTKLTGIVCNDNQIRALDFSQNKALEWVECQNNQLTALDVSNNTLLTHLSCGFNQISSLDLGNNKELTTLYCNSNQISSLTLAQNTKLTNLRCWNENLTSVMLPEKAANSFNINLYWGFWSGWKYSNSQGTTALSTDAYVPTEIPFTAISNTGEQTIEFTAWSAAEYELTGLTLSNTKPEVGDTITAAVTQADATVTYQWYRGNNAIQNATAKSYTATLDDLGSTLKCVATGTGLYTGTVSAETGVVKRCSLDTPEITTACVVGKKICTAWNAVDHAATYNVEYRIANAAKWTLKKGIKTTEFSFSGKAGNFYEVRVTAITGKQSDLENSEAAEATIAFTKALNNPKLKNTYLGDDNASVSVTGIAADATHLIVKLGADSVRIPAEGGNVEIGTAQCDFRDGTLYFTGLTSSTKYTLEVQQMIDEPGVQISSAVVKATVKTTKTCYNTPQNVTAETVSDTQVQVDWSTVTGKNSTQPANFYTVQYSVAGKNKWSTASKKATNGSFLVTKLKGGTSYDFRVFASKDSAFLASNFSELATAVTLPTAPKIASVKSPQPRTAVLTWTQNKDVQSYEIRYAIKGTNDWQTVQVPATTEKKMTYTFPELTSGKPYEFQIRALDNQQTFSAWSVSKVLSKVK